MSAILDHPAKPLDVCQQILEMTIERMVGVYKVAAALASQPSVEPSDLGWLCHIAAQEEEITHASGNLIHRWRIHGDQAGRAHAFVLLERRDELERVQKLIQEALATRPAPKRVEEDKIRPGRHAGYTHRERGRTSRSTKQKHDDDAYREWPWNGTGKAIEQFETDANNSNYYVALPEKLTADQLRRLFSRHRPREYVSYSVLAQVLSHPACPGDLVEEAWPMIRQMVICVSSLAAGVALLANVDANAIARVCGEGSGHEVLASGVDNLIRRWRETGDRASRRELAKLRYALSFDRAWRWIENSLDIK